MNTVGTSTTIPVDDSKYHTTGFFEHGSTGPTRITANEGNHHCFKWTIRKFDSYLPRGEYLKSPIFTVANRNECKWYLSIQSMYDGTDKNFIFSSLHLVLDRTSDCKEAVAKFRLFILGDRATHDCNLLSGDTFKFAKNFENKTGILSSVGKNQLYNDNSLSSYRGPRNAVTIVCEIMIKTTSHEDNNLSNDFGSVLKNQLFTDIVISVGEKKYPAHKAILAGRSSVFAAMFAQNTNTILKKGVVYINDVEEEVVEEFLRYIYSGKVEKLENLGRALMLAADQYCVEGLRILCENELAANLSGSNALDLLVFAKENDFNGLKSQTIDFILSRCATIKKTEAWESLDETDFDILKVLCEGLLDL